MGKLISQLLILLLLYRYYKRMYGEWSSWHLLFAVWNVGTLLAAGIGTALFWEYRYKPAGHFLLYLYYTGVFSTTMYTLWCLFIWLMLGSRLSEGWWARLSRYFQQLLLMGLSQVCYATQARDYSFWWRRQLYAPLLQWCSYFQLANTCAVFGVLVVMLLLGSLGFFDTLSCEGWWHWAYWQAWDYVGLGHCVSAFIVALIVARAYFLGVLLYGTVRDVDTGIIYRTWLRLTSARRIVVHDSLFPMHIQSWDEWEARGPWYEEKQLEYYELPANWYSYHCYAFDWDYAVNEGRFYRYYYFNKRLILWLAGFSSKYKRLLEYNSENCMTHLYEEEDFG